MRPRRGHLFWGITLLLLGAIPLAARAGLVPTDALADAWRLWPVAIIAAGLALILFRRASGTAGVAAAVLLPRSYAVDLGFLLALRFLFGTFQAGTFPILSRLIADWMPTTERGSAQGFIWMCSRAGGVLAPMVMVWSARLSIRALFAGT